MTELEAVNIALQTIGEMTLTTATTIPDVYEASTALEILTETRRTVLSEGLNCNTDEDWDFTADATGYVALASNVLRIEASNASLNYIAKDNKVYNKDDNTFLFDPNETVTLDVVWDLDFDNIPPAVAYYIAIKASRLTYQRLIGSTDVIRVLLQDEQEAKQKMIDHDTDTRNYNIFDNNANRRVITRTRNPRGIFG